MSSFKDFFVSPLEPNAERPERLLRSIQYPRSIALLCRPASALTAGSALAAGLGRRLREPASLALFWHGGERVELLGGFLALPQAKRLAEQLSAFSLVPTAAGRLVRAALPRDTSEAEVVYERLAEGWDIPTVSVICGPRDMAVDRVINRHDVVYLADTQTRSSTLEQYARSSLSSLRPPVIEWVFEPGPLSRLLVSAGASVGAVSRKQLAMGAANQIGVEVSR